MGPLEGQESHEKQLVLVGGGHAHIQVLRHLIDRPSPHFRTVLLVDRPKSLYSGMVPGVISGQYKIEEAEIDLLQLATRAGATLLLAPMTGLDPVSKRVLTEAYPPIPYDVLSINIGSTVRGWESIPGTSGIVVATRPIWKVTRELDRWIDQEKRTNTRERDLVVVGAGPGGVEIAFCVKRRLEKEGLHKVRVTLLDREQRILHGFPKGLSESVAKHMHAQGIHVRTGVEVKVVDGSILRGSTGESFSFDFLFWTTGAAPAPVLKAMNLPLDKNGYIRVSRALQCQNFPDIFAAGDCVSIEDSFQPAKSGVYAVRQGPVLTENLNRWIRGRPLKRYRPQRDYLMLLNVGDETGFGCKFGISFSGGWVWEWKDRIDRKFMKMFQMTPSETGSSPMGNAMFCGGCAAKATSSVLSEGLETLNQKSHRHVLVGPSDFEDVAVVQIGKDSPLVLTVDYFPGFFSDPMTVSKIAAENAMSDVYVKGAVPAFALMTVVLPRRRHGVQSWILKSALEGARQVFASHDVDLVGGQTSIGEEFAIGFSVIGHLRQPDGGGLLRKNALQAGDLLILSKPLGTGVMMAATRMGVASSDWAFEAIDSMKLSNRMAAEVLSDEGVLAATDVTGFGLVGHLDEMVRASNVGVELRIEEIPFLKGLAECLTQGIRSSSHEENQRMEKSLEIYPNVWRNPLLPGLYDPQTSGGILCGVHPSKATRILNRLKEAGYMKAAVIGEVVPSPVKMIVK